MDWQADPYGTVPSIEGGQLPMYELVDFLKQFPGHPQPLTPHHPNYVASDWMVWDAGQDTVS